MIAHGSSLPMIGKHDAMRDDGVLWRALGLVAALLLLVIVALLSLRFGSISISTQDAWNALFHFDASNYNEVVVRNLRLPRTVIAIGVGAGLAVAGAAAQAVTRNPLAEPAILGISNGATLGVVIAIFFLGFTATYQFIWFAFGGAFLASALVFLIAASGRGGATPIKLTLTGVVISWFLSAWTSSLLLIDEKTMDTVRFWMAGSVAGRDLSTFWAIAPFLLGGILLCGFLGNQLNIMSLGEDSARALGMSTARTRVVVFALVVVITGAGVAVAGPIAFVGLATPHIIRSIVGPDYRWILPYSIVGGAIFLTLADIVGRIIVRPAELQVGIVTALVGAPFLIVLARRRSIEN